MTGRPRPGPRNGIRLSAEAGGLESLDLAPWDHVLTWHWFVFGGPTLHCPLLPLAPPSLPRPAFFYAAFALQVAIEVIRGRVAVYDYCFCDDVITIIIVPRLTAHTGHRPAKFQATTG